MKGVDGDRMVIKVVKPLYLACAISGPDLREDVVEVEAVRMSVEQVGMTREESIVSLTARPDSDSEWTHCPSRRRKRETNVDGERGRDSTRKRPKEKERNGGDCEVQATVTSRKEWKDPVCNPREAKCDSRWVVSVEKGVPGQSSGSRCRCNSARLGSISQVYSSIGYIRLSTPQLFCSPSAALSVFVPCLVLGALTRSVTTKTRLTAALHL